MSSDSMCRVNFVGVIALFWVVWNFHVHTNRVKTVSHVGRLLAVVFPVLGHGCGAVRYNLRAPVGSTAITATTWRVLERGCSSQNGISSAAPLAVDLSAHGIATTARSVVQ